ncbi:MAG TPA: NUDIX domain-containing protein [Methylomirabilota bacterium]|jgi:ADP-ribose pyrophosphatase YjhB (NUDIX family)|nr:NUDIX domain-containing protein [Methylomirabilota bacterium]
MPRVGAAALITDDEGRVLLVRHTYGRKNWELPGGAVEQGESPMDGAVREIQEETGLSVTPTGLTGIYYDPEADFLHFVFHCVPTASDAVPRADGAEVDQAAFWSPDRLPRPISDFTRLRIRDGMAGAKYPMPTLVGPRRWFEDSEAP